MIKLKRGVKLRGLRPEMLVGIMVAEGVYAKLGYPLIITSVCDRRHSSGSLHYVGLAVDFRTRHLPSSKKMIVAGNLRQALGTEFDVVHESDHLHLEFQPKRS